MDANRHAKSRLPPELFPLCVELYIRLLAWLRGCQDFFFLAGAFFVTGAFFLEGISFFSRTFLGTLVACGVLTDLTGVADVGAVAEGGSPNQNLISASSSP